MREYKILAHHKVKTEYGLRFHLFFIYAENEADAKERALDFIQDLGFDVENVEELLVSGGEEVKGFFKRAA